MGKVPIFHDWDIKELEDPSESEDTNVVQGGRVEASEYLTHSELIKNQYFIIRMIFWLLAVWILLGLARYFLTGDSFLLLSSSPLIIPVKQIIAYVFWRDKKK